MKDLLLAYKRARIHKRSKDYQLKFEHNLESGLIELYYELENRIYKPQPSTCFIIHDPKMREVFAAQFRDRIVHHLLFDYVHVMFERQFIYDSYSCIKGRGTHFGIERLKHFILSESENHTRPCYVLKLDIAGYFMSIDRRRLLELCREILDRMKFKASDVVGKRWCDKLDFEFIDYLLEQTILCDPTADYNKIGAVEEWDLLPKNKSLFTAAPGCGLPIGNLTSQLFSNVYLNRLDQFCKRTLGCGCYGRYVDDLFVVSRDKRWLRSIIPKIRDFLYKDLHLSLNEKKTQIRDVSYGVEFLGAYILPYRTYVSNSLLRRMKNRWRIVARSDDNEHLVQSVNSYLGVLGHHNSYNIRVLELAYKSGIGDVGSFDPDYLKFFNK